MVPRGRTYCKPYAFRLVPYRFATWAFHWVRNHWRCHSMRHSLRDWGITFSFGSLAHYPILADWSLLNRFCREWVVFGFLSSQCPNQWLILSQGFVDNFFGIPSLRWWHGRRLYCPRRRGAWGWETLRLRIQPSWLSLFGTSTAGRSLSGCVELIIST